MNHPEQVQDPLKPLHRVTEPDPRFQAFQATLEQQHEELEEIRLHAGVPLHVRQLFETAKNLSLYSWFVYRFHQVAELMAYTTLERALRERFAHERGMEVEKVRETLAPLMETATENGWLKSEHFSTTKNLAYQQLQQEQLIRLIQENRFGDQPVEVPEVPAAEIIARAAQLNYVERLAEGIPYLRNHLAHGGPVLHPDSASTLRIVSEAINQLFEDIATDGKPDESTEL
ncbi:MAG: hypothetical protein WCC14_07475 [Acidobacteriaceae bacterium]